MLEEAQRAVEFTRGMGKAEFLADTRTIYAVVRCINIIGEAANAVSEDARDGLPEVPWHAVRGMRNRLIHEYFEVDLSVLWNTVDKRIPQLIQILLRLPPDAVAQADA